MNRRLLAALVGVMLLVLAACGDDDDSANENVDDSPNANVDDSANENGDTDVVLLTATRLLPLTELLVAEFEATDPGFSIEVLSVTGQQAMEQALENESADLAVTPDLWVPESVDAERNPFGRNLVVIATAEGNPDGITLESFAADSAANVQVCTEAVEDLNLGAVVLGNAGIEPDPAIIARRCRDEALEDVGNGDLDAVLILRSGVVVPDGLEFAQVDEAVNVIIDLVEITFTDDEAVDAFASFLFSAEATAILEERGYLP